MKRKTLALVLFALVSAVGAETRDEAKFSEEAEATATQLMERIEAEIAAAPNHPWAGLYRKGDGLSVNVSLWLAPNAGYVFEWYGCLGLYDRNYGGVAESNGVIRLSFTFANERKGIGIADEFIPVAWGERLYLIPPDKMVKFCNDFNSGSMNLPPIRGHGLHLLRADGKAKEGSGLPEVPEAWRSCVLAEPITAAITEVGETTRRPSTQDWEFVDIAVTVDAGKDKGVFKGMELYVVKPKTMTPLTVTEVGDTTSQAVLTRIGKDGSKPPPQIGWELSTQRWSDADFATLRGLLTRDETH